MHATYVLSAGLDGYLDRGSQRMSNERCVPSKVCVYFCHIVNSEFCCSYEHFYCIIIIIVKYK